MALSGTLETFSLPDVLRLLSTTKKTGVLALDGDRGTGRIWVADGAIVAAEAERAGHSDDDGVLFELLRFTEAEFEFDATTDLPHGADGGREVDAALELAEARLAEWRDIEAVVPSLDVRVRMVAEVDGAVTVGADDWRLLARIGTGASGHDVADHLAKGEYEVCSALRDLVEAGMVEVVGQEPVAGDEPAVADAFEAMLHAPVPETPVFDLAAEPVPEPETHLEPAPEPEPEPTPETAELLTDLSHLSPRAAAAVEATWAGGPEAAPDPAAEDAPERDDVDQNLLLRFLSSSKP